jgi:hypothetical protein
LQVSVLRGVYNIYGWRLFSCHLEPENGLKKEKETLLPGRTSQNGPIIEAFSHESKKSPLMLQALLRVFFKVENWTVVIQCQPIKRRDMEQIHRKLTDEQLRLVLKNFCEGHLSREEL